MKKLMFLLLVVLLVGCTKYENGECVENCDEPFAQEESVQEEPEADIEALQADFQHIIDESQGVIQEINNGSDYQKIEMVIDGNTWEESSETDKLDYAETMSKTITNMLYEHKVVERGNTVVLDILDDNGYELATQGILSGEFEIKR